VAYTQIELCNRRWQALKNERSSFLSRWRDLSDYIMPYQGRFLVTDRNRGEIKHNKIYDNTGTIALRDLAAGMMSGSTSPVLPWFALTITDRDMLQFQPVKKWLNDVTEIIQDTLLKSNCYQVLAGAYREQGLYGTFGALLEDSFKSVIHLHPFTAGEFAIATDWDGQVNTLYREFDVSVGALVREFGLANCSNTVKKLYERNNTDAWITIAHGIEPRKERDITKKDNKNFPFSSIYFEAGSNDKILRESGYKTFPCVTPRWDVAGGDIYGNSPADDAIGDIMALQASEYRKHQAIDYKANPPKQIPYSMKGREGDTFPGGTSYYDPVSGAYGIKNALEITLDIRELMVDQQEKRERIKASFYSDIFKAITQMVGTKTAYEVAQIKEEKMMFLGPVVDRNNNELQSPLITTIFERLAAANMLPPAPEELQGQELNIEHKSILSLAQKATSVSGIDRFTQQLGVIASAKPGVLDKFNEDYWAEHYSDKMGIDPELIYGGEQVALIRQQREQAQQQEQQRQAIQQGSEALRNIGQINTQPGTVAGDALTMMWGG